MDSLSLVVVMLLILGWTARRNRLIVSLGNRSVWILDSFGFTVTLTDSDGNELADLTEYVDPLSVRWQPHG